jgi:hypothetical protein
MGWLNNTTFLFMGMQNFTNAAYERASKKFDQRHAPVATATLQALHTAGSSSPRTKGNG